MAGHGARNSGGGKGRLRAKNQEMAAMMKKLNIQRTHCNCPICHRPVRLPFSNWNTHRCH